MYKWHSGNLNGILLSSFALWFQLRVRKGFKILHVEEKFKKKDIFADQDTRVLPLKCIHYPKYDLLSFTNTNWTLNKTPYYQLKV